MNILITGGTGLIGSAFIQRFSGCDFTVLTRSISKAQRVLPDSVTLIDSLGSLHNLDTFDAVINLAGEPIIDKRWSDQQKELICNSRWQITQQLVELFAHSQKPPSVFLSGSAIGVYGNRGEDILTEATCVQECDFSTKLCIHWEEVARQAEPYTRVILLRTGIVLAAHGGALSKMLFAFKCCLGGRIGSGGQWMSWVHYQDHINAMYYLLTQQSISGAVNIVAPEALTNAEFTQTLAARLHRWAIFTVPKKLLRFLLGESSCLLLDSQRVKPEKLLINGFKFEFTNLKKALLNLL